MKNYLMSLILILSIVLISAGCSASPAPATSGGTTSPSAKAPTTTAAPTSASPSVTSAAPNTVTASPAVSSKPTTPAAPVTTSAAAKTADPPAVQKAWHLSEVQQWDTYKDLKPPYQISWKGAEGDLVSTVTADMPAKPVSSINAKWTIPAKMLVPGSEYTMEYSVTAVAQHTATLGLEGSIMSGLDVFNVLPDGATGARIKIIPDDKVPKIVWNAPDGTVKSGKFTFKAPEYGFADSKTTNKMTLTVLYYSSARLAWRYIYEWTDKDLTPVKTGTQTMP